MSSNLARYDGVRYGLRVVPEDGPVTIERVMSATRSAGFGHEVKRRIILGTYALSAGNFDAYYGAALRVRTLIQRDYAAAFEKCDVLISPTAPSTAFKLGEKTEGDPMAMYLGDVATVPVTWQASRRSPCPAASPKRTTCPSASSSPHPHAKTHASTASAQHWKNCSPQNGAHRSTRACPTPKL